jgi:ADP-ribose pyrophosphatase YjhB (NUDIX family)
MEKSSIIKEYDGLSGEKYIFEYFDCDSFEDLPQNEIKQCYAVAFHKDKIVIVHNIKKGTWGLVGGSVENGETIDETLSREVQEESNMKVISHRPIGCQRVTEVHTGKIYYQLRYFAIVEPYGPFVSDPDLTIDEMLEIDPRDYKKYFDWFEIGDAIMDKALNIKNRVVH